MPSSIARMMLGTPAMTKTLPIWNPGAWLIGLSIRMPPAGTLAMRNRASFNWPAA